jgi:histone H3/H4
MSEIVPTPKAIKPKKKKSIVSKAKTGGSLICNNDVHRLAQRGGVKSVSSTVPVAIRIKTIDDLERFMRAMRGVLPPKRRTITERDARLAFERIKQTVWV